jgi:AcrR family transcriptional regulator
VSTPVNDDEGLRAGEATRTRLMEAGIEVMARRGYHATRIDDVAKLAGVSHGTFYLYFTNKDDLMLTLAERCATELGELTAQLGDIAEGPAGRRQVRRWLTDFLDLYRAYGVVIRSWVENQSSDPKLTRLGIDYLGVVSGTLIDRLTTVHPEDAGLRVAALISLIERFTYLVVTRDLGEEAEVLDTAATVIHRSFFAAAPSKS